MKPDLLAVGSNVYTAWASSLGTGGYMVASGTSLSAPMVTGAAALLKAARPGLTAAPIPVATDQQQSHVFDR